MDADWKLGDMAAEIERLRRELSYHVHTDEDIKVQNAEIDRLREALFMCRFMAYGDPTEAQMRIIVRHINSVFENKERRLGYKVKADGWRE